MAPGGAFQAGAMLAAAAIVLRLCGYSGAGLPGAAAQQLLLASGVGVFGAVGIAVTADGAAFLQYRGEHAGMLILIIETAAMTAIAVTLALAYIGGKPASWSPALAPRSKLERDGDTP